jgi:hypothetical protein
MTFSMLYAVLAFQLLERSKIDINNNSHDNIDEDNNNVKSKNNKEIEMVVLRK